MKSSKPWSHEAWTAALSIFEDIKKLPFLAELAKGTLSNERFHHYITQDHLYLGEYARVLAHAASRMPRRDDFAAFLAFAREADEVEGSLHSGYNPDLNASMSDACLAYTSFLRAQATAPLAVECAAILPCFWIYQKVGEYVLSQAKIEGNPYQDWILLYSDPAFDANTKQAIEICDRMAAEGDDALRQQMTQAYVECSRMELLFWDSAYRLGAK